ncbi:hypothetical protein [Amycolatopsis anabasis]|uniref:hypothetical protein n=1 Tax=Amycolatopsis anabasis TaxID=1840409 RepID=UPI00131C50A6|nr:hypothetical protein [Amycolatopsis anabasis]
MTVLDIESLATTVRDAVAAFRAAAEGDSADAEYDVATELASAAEALGVAVMEVPDGR